MPDPATSARNRLVPKPPNGRPPSPVWTFLTNHARVLVCLAGDPAATMRAVAAEVGVTERAVQRIVAELGEAGYLTVTREGRRNRYAVHRRRPLRHALHAHCTVGDLLDLCAPPRA